MSVAGVRDDVVSTHAHGVASRWTGLAIALALVLCGCGSTALSGGQLRSRATSLCRQATTQTSRILTPASPAVAGPFFERGVTVLSPELAALRTLKPPSSAAAVYTTALNALAGKLTALREAVRDLAHGEDPVIATKTLEQELAPLESEENDAWRALGIPGCVNP